MTSSIDKKFKSPPSHPNLIIDCLIVGMGLLKEEDHIKEKKKNERNLLG